MDGYAWRFNNLQQHFWVFANIDASLTPLQESIASYDRCLIDTSIIHAPVAGNLLDHPSNSSNKPYQTTHSLPSHRSHHLPVHRVHSRPSVHPRPRHGSAGARRGLPGGRWPSRQGRRRGVAVGRRARAPRAAGGPWWNGCGGAGRKGDMDVEVAMYIIQLKYAEMISHVHGQMGGFL